MFADDPNARALRFGIFLAPFHPVGQNPTLAFERDLALIEHLDRLGYDEAWIGEHHSAGFEIIASPEVFIAAAAQRTQRIRLGTGVSSLPYHHPFMLADRMVQLSHMTRGRAMFGAGPGALPSDAYMLGLEPTRQREMMEEGLDVILRLFAGETVTAKTDWFTCNEARLQLLPYGGHIETAVAAQVSPAGPRTAGRFGTGLLSLGATSAGGFDVLGLHWDVITQRAAEFGQVADRGRWRLVGPMHVAETEAQARADVAYGIREWLGYFKHVAALPLAAEADETDVDSVCDAMIASGLAVIGTPDQAIAQIERLWEQSNGGFGAYLFMANDWANPQAQHRSYELFAQYVMPRFQFSAQKQVESRDWAAANRDQFIGGATNAVIKAMTDHQAEKDAKAAAAV